MLTAEIMSDDEGKETIEQSGSRFAAAGNKRPTTDHDVGWQGRHRE